ncbi:hypothetical protein J1N35_014190 [Gossypium stocksii]|uniref:Reverse transcriptase domain-containing protein n=1 Tax=Gossypium stocksii TaxID=47602 RepID=A0A9D3VVX8_9ROSI|nr:hypothetical protein J1N35_014190 [Gossypium stocksii]
METCGPMLKEKVGLILEPNMSINNLKENLQSIRKPVNSLGFGDITADQARGVLDLFYLVLVAQQSPVVAGRGSQPNAAVGLQTVSGKGSSKAFKNRGKGYAKKRLNYFMATIPDRSKRKLLWEGLRSVNPNLSFPWLIMGDFNAILSLSDKKVLSPLWDILGQDVCQWVKDVFAGRPIEPELNNTLIVLIPKKESLEDFSHFRPISLCSVLYKSVMKVIANRFKEIFPKLISQEQVGFIARHNISNNIILAQKVIHSMRYNQKGRKWMAIKLDSEKAYDRVSWEFINVSMVAAGIPIFLRNVIMTAIFPLLCKFYGIECSLKSSNLKEEFVRAILYHLIYLCFEWNGPSVSHLFFTDDLMIFYKAQVDQARLLDSILTQFCEISSHKISVRKSNIFFSKDTEADVRNQINRLFGFQKV